MAFQPHFEQQEKREATDINMSSPLTGVRLSLLRRKNKGAVGEDTQLRPVEFIAYYILELRIYSSLTHVCVADASVGCACMVGSILDKVLHVLQAAKPGFSKLD